MCLRNICQSIIFCGLKEQLFNLTVTMHKMNLFGTKLCIDSNGASISSVVGWWTTVVDLRNTYYSLKTIVYRDRKCIWLLYLDHFALKV